MGKKIYRAVIVFCVLINFIFVILLSLTLFYMTDVCTLPTLYKPLDNVILTNSNIIVSNISDCANLSAIKASYCLNEHFKVFFKYNITDDYEYDNFSIIDKYIRQYGGDCHESAVWFSKAGGSLGYNTKYVSFTTGFKNDTDENLPIIRYLHSLAVISDRDGFCFLDQGKLVNCNTFKNDGDYNATR